MLRRLLKVLLRPRSTSKLPPLVQEPYPEEEEERIALTSYATFDVVEFFRRTGYQVRNERYFLQAVVHRSYLQLCPPGTFQSNERMEFLGDSVLNLIVAEHLYMTFPNAEEGELSKVRSRLVNRYALGDAARGLTLEDFLLMSPSAHQSIRSGSNSILVDAMEAFVAAIYLDGGYVAAKAFVHRHLLENYAGAKLAFDDNYKSTLLELAQGRGLGIPRYVLVEESGPDHSPMFTMEVQIDGIPVGVGTGGNKKAAEQMAAAKALERFRDGGELQR